MSFARPIKLTELSINIFRWVDRQLKLGQLGSSRCDAVLFAVDVKRLDEDLLVGLLTATYAGSNNIRGRVAFASRVKRRLARRLGLTQRTPSSMS